MHEVKKFSNSVLLNLKETNESTFEFGEKGTKNIYHGQLNFETKYYIALRPKLLFPSSAKIHIELDKY